MKILNRPLDTERVTTKTGKATSGHHTKSPFATQRRDAKNKVTPGQLEAKILNRRLDTKDVPAKKIEATSGHQERAPNRNSRSESSEPRSEGPNRSDTNHTQQKSCEIIGFPEGTVALQNSQFIFLCVQTYSVDKSQIICSAGQNLGYDAFLTVIAHCAVDQIDSKSSEKVPPGPIFQFLGSIFENFGLFSLKK